MLIFDSYVDIPGFSNELSIVNTNSKEPPGFEFSRSFKTADTHRLFLVRRQQLPRVKVPFSESWKRKARWSPICEAFLIQCRLASCRKQSTCVLKPPEEDVFWRISCHLVALVRVHCGPTIWKNTYHFCKYFRRIKHENRESEIERQRIYQGVLKFDCEVNNWRIFAPYLSKEALWKLWFIFNGPSLAKKPIKKNNASFDAWSFIDSKVNGLEPFICPPNLKIHLGIRAPRVLLFLCCLH